MAKAFDFFSKPDVVVVQYDHRLRQITGKVAETCYLSATEQPFLFFLHCLFTSYPEIQSRYPPGKLAILLNGEAPDINSVMKNGDILQLWATS